MCLILVTTTVEVVHEVYMTHSEASRLSVTIQWSDIWITMNLCCAVEVVRGHVALTLSLARLPQQTAVSKISQRGQTCESPGGWHPHTQTLIIYFFYHFPDSKVSNIHEICIVCATKTNKHNIRREKMQKLTYIALLVGSGAAAEWMKDHGTEKKKK